MQSDPSVFEQTLTLELSALQPELRVLIVDDDPDARDYLVAVVQEAGYRTAVAASGEQALQLLDTEFCPIMITDRQHAGHGRRHAVQAGARRPLSRLLIYIPAHGAERQRRYRVGLEGGRGRLSGQEAIFRRPS